MEVYFFQRHKTTVPKVMWIQMAQLHVIFSLTWQQNKDLGEDFYKDWKILE